MKVFIFVFFIFLEK
jgi:hypothetical protein